VTGSNDRSWNSLDRVIAPALLASIEAAWVSIWIAALWYISPGERVDVPFAAIAIVATIAIALVSLAGVLVAHDRLRFLLRVVLAIVVGTMSAGVIGVAYLHGSFLTFGLHPWTVPAGPESSEAAAGWFVAAIAVARGSWLGSVELGRRHVVNSLIAATSAFVVFFLVAVTHRSEVAYAGEVRAAEVLLLVCFPFAIALLAVVSERERERNALRNRLSRPTVAWLGAVLVPMVVVAGIAVALALGVRPLIPLVAGVLRRAGLWVLDVLDDILSFIGSLVHLPARTQTHVIVRSGGVSHLRAGSSRTPAWISVLGVILAVALLGLLLVVALRAIRAFLRRRRPRKAQTTPLLDEERDSVFSWSHLLDQLLGVLRRLLGGRAAADTEMRGAISAELAGGEGRRSVRSHYRQVLAAARIAGYPRRVFETPLELDSRLAPLTDEVAARALSNLTDLYDSVRYGGHLATSDEVASAGADAEAFVAALQLSGDYDRADDDPIGSSDPD
jgi:hypothetical protein